MVKTIGSHNMTVLYVELITRCDIKGLHCISNFLLQHLGLQYFIPGARACDCSASSDVISAV